MGRGIRFTTEFKRVATILQPGAAIFTSKTGLAQLTVCWRILVRLLLAKSGSQDHVAGTSALPPIADIRAPMSGFWLIWSDLSPGADLP